MAELPKRHILVFLPQAAAMQIAGILDDNGYLASAVSSVPALDEALKSGDYCLAVTTRPDIDIVRNIQALPVVNLEIFFHVDPHGKSADVRAKHFDAAAFLARVKVLIETRRVIVKPALVYNAAPSKRAGIGFGSWFGF